MTPVPKYTRPVALIIAAVVAIIAVATTANAVQTVILLNAAKMNYALAGGANSAAIAPPQGVPVLFMGINATPGDRGVAQVTVHVPNAAPQFVQWVGFESNSIVGPGAATTTTGYNSAAGTHIAYLDFGNSVDLQINTPTTMRIHNSGAFGAQTGNLTWTW